MRVKPFEEYSHDPFWRWKTGQTAKWAMGNWK